MGTARTIAGKYQILEEIGTGGMASVHVARIVGPAGFSRIVAVKRMHDHIAKDPKFVRMFLEEGRLAGRIHHPNVVATLDVLVEEREVYLVLEYVRGESLAKLLRAGAAGGHRMSVPMACAIVTGILSGLQAAHEATGEGMKSLEIIHRDVSPENVLVGTDGIPRVLDFGIAKAASRVESTASGGLRGKLGYMAPEQLLGDKIDRRVDIYATGVVLWEMLTGSRLFERRGSVEVVNAILGGGVPPPSKLAPGVPPELDAVALRALAATPAERFETALEMANALEMAAPVVSAREVGAWVESVAGESIRARARRLAQLDVGDTRVRTVGSLLERKAPADQMTDDLGAEAPAALKEELQPTTTATVALPRRRIFAVAVALVAFATIVLVLTAFSLLRGRARIESRVTPVTSTTSSSPALPAPAASTVEQAVVLSTPPRKAPPAPAPPPKHEGSRRRPTNQARCNPPFVIEPDGTKRFKTECL